MGRLKSVKNISVQNTHTFIHHTQKHMDIHIHMQACIYIHVTTTEEKEAKDEFREGKVKGRMMYLYYYLKKKYFKKR